MTNPLSLEQLEKQKRALVQRARELREEIRRTLKKSDSEHYVQIADTVRDLEDESFADLMVDVNLAEIDRDLDELRAIEKALLHAADGSYGRCEECGGPIGYNRLVASPAAHRCIDCQTVHERTHYYKLGHTL
jgi:RNA polymerase-binding protein DksA